MSWTKGIARYVLGIGVLLLGPVWTMITFPEKLGASYVFGAIDALLVVFGMLILFSGSSTTSEDHSKAG